MSERFTAQEMRKKVTVMLGGLGEGIVTMPSQASSREVAAMLQQAADTEEERKRLLELLGEKQFRLDECLRVLDETRNEREVLRNRVIAGLDACQKEVDKLPPNGNIDTRLMEEARIGRIRQALKGEEVVG